MDAATNIYVSDSGNNLLRKIAPGGMVTTLAGVGGGGGYLDGPGSIAKFFGPSGLGLDAAGNIYVADAFNNLVRKITPAGVVSTVAGVPGVAGNDNGPATNATFYDPQGVDVDQFTNIYVADTGNSTIRLITPGGLVTNFAGTPSFIGYTDGPGSNALFNRRRASAWTASEMFMSPIRGTTPFASSPPAAWSARWPAWRAFRAAPTERTAERDYPAFPV